jgi:hypothetical protein
LYSPASSSILTVKNPGGDPVSSLASAPGTLNGSVHSIPIF